MDKWRTWATALPLLLMAGAATTEAQPAELSRLALDTVAAVDQAVDGSGNLATGVTLDAVVSFDLGRGFEALARPFVQRLTTGEWNRQVWVAAVRYQHAGPLSVRIDAGLIPSPVGLANLTLRPHQIPTIFQPASLFLPLPPVELRAPRTSVLGVLYPYGGSVTLSSRRWDARAAVIDTSPLRTRRVFGRVNPPRLRNVVVGGGVTPAAGLRVGGSVTHGRWQRAGETADITADRDATVLTIETEFSIRYTKLTGEWVRDWLATAAGHEHASGWFVQAQQTLTPRWFAAGRAERIDAPAVTTPATRQVQHFTGIEGTVGYRVSPEITLRAGHRARRGFGRTGYDHQAAVSVVWWQRWF